MIMQIKVLNKTLMEEIEIGVDKLGYILTSADLGQAEASNSTTPYINLVGQNVNATSLLPRDISIKGSVINNGVGIESKKSKLCRLINPCDEIVITFGNYKITAKPDKSIIFSLEARRNNKRFCDFAIEATAYMPALKRITEEVFYYSNAIKRPLFPMVIPKNKGICFGIKAALNTQNLINDGDIETGFVCKMTAQYGDVINPKIINNKTGKYIEIMLSLLKGDSIEVSTIAGDKYVKFVRGKSEMDVFKCITKKSTMSMTLNTGQNDITITAAINATNLSSLIKLTPLYLEVQE